MKRPQNRLHKTVLLTSLIILLGVLAACSSNKSSTEQQSIARSSMQAATDNLITIWTISDMHHLASSLKEDNQEFTRFITQGDGRLLTYSDTLMEALIWEIGEKKPDILIVSGDLTTNGARESHMELAGFFYRVEELGTEVYVVPGNHDINNPYALSFVGNMRTRVDSIDPKEFASIYDDFGYNQALSRDPNSLSYLVSLRDNLYVLMLDSNNYNFNYQFGFPLSSGRLQEETLLWIDTLQNQLTGVQVFGVGHHNLVTHSKMFTRGFNMDNQLDVAEKLTSLGIDLYLSGHIHIQDIAYDPTYGIYDIATGSTTQYEQGYGAIEITEDALTYTAKAIDMEGYAKELGLDDPKLQNFTTYAQEYFTKQSHGMVDRMLPETYTENEREAIQTVFAEINLRHFRGTDGLDKDYIRGLEGYKLVQDSSLEFMQHYFDAILEEDRNDRYLQIPW